MTQRLVAFAYLGRELKNINFHFFLCAGPLSNLSYAIVLSIFPFYYFPLILWVMLPGFILFCVFFFFQSWFGSGGGREKDWRSAQPAGFWLNNRWWQRPGDRRLGHLGRILPSQAHWLQVRSLLRHLIRFLRLAISWQNHSGRNKLYVWFTINSAQKYLAEELPSETID